MGSFDGYSFQTEDEEQVVKNDGFFSLDSNVVLDLIRYDKSHREAWFRELEKVKDRVVVTNTAATEILNNIDRVLRETQNNSYEDVIDSLRAQKRKVKKMKDGKNHPTIGQDVAGRFALATDALIDDLEKNARTAGEEQAAIRTQIIELLQEVVGEPCPNKFDELRMSERRLANGIPPGAGDANKCTALDRAGDYLIWKENLHRAKEKGKPFVFVTSDKKDAWERDTKRKKDVADRRLTGECFAFAGHRCVYMPPGEFIALLGAETATVEATKNEEARTQTRELELTIDAMARQGNRPLQEQLAALRTSARMNLDVQDLGKLSRAIEESNRPLQEQLAALRTSARMNSDVQNFGKISRAVQENIEASKHIAQLLKGIGATARNPSVKESSDEPEKKENDDDE